MQTRRAKFLSSTSNVATFRLPQEVIDAIIDHLHEEPESLAAVGRVSRAWYRQTRVHLFREIATYGGPKFKDRVAKLESLLQKNQDLAPFVHHIRVQAGTYRNRQQYSHLKPLVRVLPMLVSLDELTLEGFESNLTNGVIDWPDVPREVAIALFETMANPMVKKLTLARIFDFDIVPLGQLHHIRELIMQEVHSYAEEDDSLESSPGACFPLPSITTLPHPPTSDDYLRVLDISNCGSAVNILLNMSTIPEGTLHPSRIDTLLVNTTNFNHEMQHAWEVLLQRCGASVEKYDVLQDVYDADEIEMLEEPAFPRAVFAFHRFPKLKDLNITMTPHFFSEEEYNPLPLLLEGLQQVSSTGHGPSELVKMRLEFDFRALEDNGEDLDVTKGFTNLSKDKFWSSLDDTLSKPVYSKLQTLLIAVDITYCSLKKAAWTKGTQNILSQMPKTRGKVDISWYV